MNRGALLFFLFIVAAVAGCSGGGGSSTLPPPTGGFSNTSLKGQYAFIMTGEQSSVDPVARIGVFTADGNGGISGGLEIVSTTSSGLQLLTYSAAANAYSVNADGRGAMALNNITGPSSFSITMISTTQGYISQTDAQATASGTFELQDISAFTQNGINGSFVFDTSGLDPTGVPDSIVGQLNLNGGGVSAVYDENDGAVLSGPQTATGTYFLDATNGVTSGVGQLSFGNFLYDFVIVNGRKIHLIEVPGQGAIQGTFTMGTANAQTAPPTTNANFNGSFAFLTSGGGTHSPDFKAARFTADGNGGITANSIALDEKQIDSSVAQVPKGSLSAMSYAIDTSLPGSGRGTLTFKDSSLGTYSFIFYMNSATQGVIQDISAGLIADGTILAQTGMPFANGSVAGDYAFNWSGINDGNSNFPAAEEDYVGHVTVSNASSNNVTGAMDFSDFNSNNGVFHDSALTGSLTINGDGTNASGGRSTYVVKAAGTNGGPSTTFTFTLYPVNSTTMFVVSQDTHHVTGGTFTRQVTPP
jgi:hypothetical protein